MLELKPAVHDGFWIYEDGKLLMWCHSKEHAEKELKKLEGI